MSGTYNRFISVFTLIMMLSTQLALVAPLQAATAADGEALVFTVDKSTTGRESTGDGQTDSAGHLTEGQKFNQFLNGMIPYFWRDGKKNGPEWLKTTDLTFSFTDNYKTEYALTTIQPFGQADKEGQLWFWQGRYARQSSDHTSTANLGIGWRKLSADKQQLYGLNMFYDYGFPYNLSRVGVGAEYFNKLAEYRVNVYQPLSGDRLTGVADEPDGILYSYIRAVRGFDYEAGTSFSHAPWLHLYAAGYFYDNEYQSNETGYRLRSVMQFTPRFSAEIGYNQSNLSGGNFYGKVSCELADRFGPSLSSGRQETGKAVDLTGKLLQKVERDNTIKTERFTRFVAYSGSIQVHVTNSGNVPLPGAQVQACQNGVAIGRAATTDASGNALIGGITAGVYTVRVSYSTYSNDSGAITVGQNQTAGTTVSLPVPVGSATVTVTSGGSAVSGATVTVDGTSLTGTTDTNGQVTIGNITVGSYTFTASKNGYTGATSASTAISNGGTATVGIAITQQYGSATITVTSGGSGVSGATVTVNGTGLSGTTDTNGQVTISNIPVGSYTFTASKTGYTGATSASTAISNGGTATVGIAITQQYGSATITVTSGGNEVSGATVTVDGTGLSGTTDTNGQVTISNIPVGSYTFTASKTGYTGATSASTAISNGGTATVGIAITQQFGSATITVTSGGSGVSGATVTVDGTSLTGTTDTNGQVTIHSIPVGSHTFTASKTGYTGASSASTAISNGGTAAVSIAITQQFGSATITVTSGGSGVSGATVMVDGTSLSGTTDTNGQVTIHSIPVGSYTFTASKTGYVNATSASTGITNGGTTAVGIVIAQQYGSATITVTSGGSGVSGVTVTVDGIGLSGTTDTNGQVTIYSIPVGSYTFTATKTGYTGASSTSTAISDGATATVGIAITRQYGSATITVTSGGSGVNGATVTVDGTGLSGTTDTNGQVTISNIPVGSYTFTASKTGYDSATSANTAISNGGTATVGIAITRQYGSATITVTSGGSGVSGATVTVDGTGLSGTTDTNGQVTIHSIPVGNYTFTASKSGYTDASSTSTAISNGGTATVSIALPVPVGSATVAVTSGGSPVSGATVTVDGTGLSGTTDTNGQVTIHSIPVGSYTFTVSKNGYANATSASSGISYGETTNVAVSLTAQTGYAIVTVTDSSGGSPISGASVTLSGTSTLGTAVNSTVITDTDGKASFNGILVGSNYSYAVTATDYTTSTGSLAIAGTNISSNPATVTVSLHTSKVKVTVYVGSYTDTQYIFIYNDANFVASHPVTGGSAYFELEALTTGYYTAWGSTNDDHDDFSGLNGGIVDIYDATFTTSAGVYTVSL